MYQEGVPYLNQVSFLPTLLATPSMADLLLFTYCDTQRFPSNTPEVDVHGDNGT